MSNPQSSHAHDAHSHGHGKVGLTGLVVGAIGVVFGDIGTSPLYTLREAFSPHYGLVANHDTVLGILSLVFWALMMVVTVKYVTIIMRADNEGEGGIMALMALAQRTFAKGGKSAYIVGILGVFGASLFFGDGVITPAISVLSAVEGLEVVAPQMHSWIVPITVLVLAALFATQRFGTEKVGRVFGPITITWFASLAVLGVINILHQPEVLHAINPWWALRFFAEHQFHGVFILGAVVLAVTGGEAIYTDMGHFGAKPIRYAWYFFVLPALMLNYLGQGALVLEHPAAVKNPFFMMAPEWLTLPLVGLATVAAVIASQALISGAFSVTKQVIQLGYLPRLQICHTSTRDTGQIYLPFVNWSLFVMIVLAVVLFRSSSNLAAAYGIAVTLDMLITTVLTFFVIRYGWGYPLWLCVLATGFFFAIDLAFFSSNLLKLFDGGWFPLLIGGCIFMLMITWKDGRDLLISTLRTSAIDLKAFLESVFMAPPVRVEGTAVFMTSQTDVVPNALLHNLKHNKVLHEQNLFVTVRSHEVPWIGMDKRLQVDALGHDCWQIIVHYGFKNDQDLPKALALLTGRGIKLNPMSTSYFLSRDIVTPPLGSGMMLWREKLFAQMHHSATAAAEFLNLPSNAVVELGSKVEI